MSETVRAMLDEVAKPGGSGTARRPVHELLEHRRHAELIYEAAVRSWSLARIGEEFVLSRFEILVILNFAAPHAAATTVASSLGG